MKKKIDAIKDSISKLLFYGRSWLSVDPFDVSDKKISFMATNSEYRQFLVKSQNKVYQIVIKDLTDFKDTPEIADAFKDQE